MRSQCSRFGVSRARHLESFILMTPESSISTSGTLLILDTGCGGYSVLRTINKKLWKVIVVNNRAVRDFGFGSAGDLHVADALTWHPQQRRVQCRSTLSSSDLHVADALTWHPQQNRVQCRSTLSSSHFDINYEKLVIAVGALPNTFNVPGVPEHAIFLKELSDARRIRNQLLDNFERSLEPGLTPEERQRLLHTVIVGGGPTGVEFGAELYDFVQEVVGPKVQHEVMNGPV